MSCRCLVRSFRMFRLSAAGAALWMSAFMQAALAAEDCPDGYLSSTSDRPVRQTLYLMFPESTSGVDVESIGGTHHVGLFDFSLLDSSPPAQTEDLIDEIVRKVRNAYCEFNVEVVRTRMMPTSAELSDDPDTEHRWQIVGIGADRLADDKYTFLKNNHVNLSSDSRTFGYAWSSHGKTREDPDEGRHFAQVYGLQFGWNYGDAGGHAGTQLGSLAGGNSTLPRWATALAGTAAHEAGHNYHLGHELAQPTDGEDGAVNHLQATNGEGLGSGADAAGIRATRTRHFSDNSFQQLSHTLGLAAESLHSWSFVNPDSRPAASLIMTVLTKGALTLREPENGNPDHTDDGPGAPSPWTTVTRSESLGTTTIDGRETEYQTYELTWSGSREWEGARDGLVESGEAFRIAAAFAQDVIVYDVRLRDPGNNELRLQPRLPGYDDMESVADMADAGILCEDWSRFPGSGGPAAGLPDAGTLGVQFFNFQPGRELILKDVRVRFLPRPVTLAAMQENMPLRTRDDLPVREQFRQPAEGLPGPGDGLPFEQEFQEEGQGLPVVPARRISNYFAYVPLQNRVTLPIARLTDRRHLDIPPDPDDCEEGFEAIGKGLQDAAGGRMIRCRRKHALSLFPATYTYIEVTVVDPHATYWDPAQGHEVTGPQETKIYYQFAGSVMDLNKNGVDDYLDIRNGTSRDINRNGIPDEATCPAPKRRFGLSIRGGATLPHNSGLNAGFSTSLGVQYALTRRLSLEGVVGYHGMDVGPAGNLLDVWQLSLNGRYHFAPVGRLTPFVNGGLGVYFLDPGSAEFGYNVGAGVNYEIHSRLSLEGAYNFHEISTPGSNLQFSTMQVGIKVVY